ncbi:MAG: hypothetical protein CSA22_06695 [Deltaproteobacteria bacterium]|nr:MAG: hypothetical protein CSA22_06695 [Deltaproteobacteria bacterium]
MNEEQDVSIDLTGGENTAFFQMVSLAGERRVSGENPLTSGMHVGYLCNINTVIAAVIPTNLRLNTAPGNILAFSKKNR